MKVLHVNAGLETGGGLFHIINLLTAAKQKNENFQLLTFAEGPVAQAAREAGITVDVLNISSRYSNELPKALLNYIKNNNFDIVHTHGPRANLMMAKLKNNVAVKWVITVHSDPLKDFEGRGIVGKVFEKLNLRSLKKADHLLAITERFGDILKDQIGISSNKISIIYNGIFFHETVLPKLDHEEFNLVNVARMEPIKGQNLLLQAIKKADLPQLRLHLIGDGSERNNLESQVVALGLQEQVFFHGFLSHDEIQKVYQIADSAVLTSYSESFPLVLLEAADNLVPLLSTDVGDMFKMIPDEDHGTIAQVGDLDSITNGIKKIAETDSSERIQMARREKDYLVNNFSIFNQLSSILKIYDLVLND